MALLGVSIIAQLAAHVPQRTHVLAYATNISVDGLQSSQNGQRSQNGLPSLNLNEERMVL